MENNDLLNDMHMIEAQPATDDHILSVHHTDYLKLLNEITDYERPVRFDADTYALPESPVVARLSAGGVVCAVDAIFNGTADNAIAAVRPPGHHAIPERGMGFCLLGNIAIAARHAQSAYDLERIMIVDFDVHHGNGTQDMFYEDDSVLFISTHQSPYYPGTGQINETGRGKGRGYTINIPLSGGHGDVNYAEIYKEIVWPAARRFKPELILVSAGFDAHWVDPLASMALSLTGYTQLCRELIQMAETLCEGRIVFVMEGGYDLDALANGMMNIAYTLLGNDTISDPLGSYTSDEPEVATIIKKVKNIHKLD